MEDLTFWEEYDGANRPIKTVVRFTDPITLQKRRKSVNWKSKKIKTARQAQRYLRDEIEKMLEEAPIVSLLTVKTFGELTNKFIEEWESTVRATTFRQRVYLMKIINKVLPPNTSVKIIDSNYIKRVWRMGILNAKNARTGKSLTSSTLQAIRSFLKQILYYGYENGIFPSSTVYTVSLPIPKKLNSDKEKRRVARYMEEDEVREFMTALRSYCQKDYLTGYSTLKPDFRYYDFCLFLLKTGLRVGEASVLTLDKVDFEKKRITIDEQMITAGLKRADYYHDDPKTLDSIRVISVDDEVLEIIRRRVADNEKRGLSIRHWQDDQETWRKKEVKSFQETDYIFQTQYGTAITSHNLNQFLNGKKRVNGGVEDFIKKKNPKWSKHITAHSFRYTHISLLAEANVPIKAIMDRVGHKDAKTTLEIYNQATKKLKQRAVDEISNWDF